MSKENLNPELEALKAIESQVESFKTLLGEKADTATIDALKSEIASLKTGIEELTSAEVLKSIEKINTANEKLYKQIVKMQEEAAEKREQSEQTGRKAMREIAKKSDVEAFVKQLFPNGKNGEKKREYATLEVKAAETFGAITISTGDTNAITGTFIDPVLYEKKRKKNIILDYFPILTIDVPTLIYLRKIEKGTGTPPADDVVGGADWIACGAAKPLRSFRITTGEVSAKKVAIFNTIDDCLLQDVPSFMRWLQDDFAAEMREAVNDGLLNGDPDVDALEPIGLKKNAIQFTATPAFDEMIAAPTYIDAILASAALMAYNREQAAYAFVSSDVWYAMVALKGSDKRYLNNALVYTNNMGQLFIGGVEVVGVDHEDVPSTHLLMVGAENGFKIYRYGGGMMETGLNGTDFREDKTSVRMWQRYLSFIPEERENSVMYDTFANIFSAIEAPEPDNGEGGGGGGGGEGGGGGPE